MKTKVLIFISVASVGLLIMLFRVNSMPNSNRVEKPAVSSTDKNGSLNSNDIFISNRFKKSKQATTNNSSRTQSPQNYNISVLNATNGQAILKTNDWILETTIDLQSGRRAIFHSITKDVTMKDRSGNILWAANIGNIIKTSRVYSMETVKSDIRIRAFGNESILIFINVDTAKVTFDVY